MKELPYSDGVDFIIPAGKTLSDEFTVPLGSTFHIKGLNAEYEKSADNTCKLFVEIQGISEKFNYTAKPLRASLIATPGRADSGIRFGSFPWEAEIQAQDGLRFYVTNTDTVDRRITIVASGKRVI